MELQVGYSHSLKVNPREYWTDTGIFVKSGQSYEFKANGIWVDWFIPSKANGYRGNLLSFIRNKKRVPQYNWMALMGALDQDEKNCFLIGSDNQVDFIRPGKIMCFANDMKTGWFFLANNWRKVYLTIRRIK